MNPSEGREQRDGGLARRELFTRPFARMAREQAPPEGGESVPGRIPLITPEDQDA
jgi:hypothetical protein